VRYATGLGFAPLLAVAPAAGPAAPIVAAIALAPMLFKPIVGLFTKDECKVEYDAERQKFWDYEARLLNVDTENSWEAWKKAGTLTYERGAWIINQMTTALDQFKAYTDHVRQSCDGTWIDERFHDYYDFFWNVVQNLKKELADIDARRMESGSIIQNAASSIARLFDPVPGASYFPQAGTLPPVNTMPALYRDGGPVQPGATVPSGLLLGGLALVGGYLLFSRSPRR
jgi:hypothetical protein